MLGLSNILMNTQGECPCLYVASSYHKLFAAPLALISTAKLRCQALFRLNNIVVALVVMTVFFDHMFKAEVRYINIHIYSYLYIYVFILRKVGRELRQYMILKIKFCSCTEF